MLMRGCGVNECEERDTPNESRLWTTNYCRGKLLEQVQSLQHVLRRSS